MKVALKEVSVYNNIFQQCNDLPILHSPHPTAGGPKYIYYD